MTATAPVTEALPHWDLSNVYPGLDSEAFLDAVEAVNRRLEEMERYLDEHNVSRNQAVPGQPGASSAPVVEGFLERMNALADLSNTVSAYVRGLVATDSYNAEAKRWLSKLEQSGVRLRRQMVRFEGWLGEHGAALDEILAQSPAAQAHAFFLRETVEQSRYLMSEAEEALAAELSTSGDMAWSKLQGTITSQLVVPFERDGRTEQLPITAVQNLGHDPDPAVRRRAYEVELAAWESVREPLAAALNGVKGFRVTLNQRRGRPDALHGALDQARLDDETLEAMLGAIEDSFPAFRRYLRAKARRLGHANGLPWWDIEAPVLPPGAGAEQHYSFEEARALVLEQFAGFSENLARLAERAFRERWIDAEPRPGKRGGAFCMGLPAVRESRVLCNFDGSTDQVLTVAHELGHAYHNDCLFPRQPLQRPTPMTLAETASTLCETIVTDAVLDRTSHPAEELAILDAFLIRATQINVDITSRFRFEKEVFERRAQAELSADELCEIMLRAQAETYGDGLDERYRHPYMWAWKPHYYRPELSFYNFPYAFGLLFGMGLYALFKARGPAFVPEYEALLASTGEARPAELAARFGIDLRQRAFWKGSLEVIEARIERYMQM